MRKDELHVKSDCSFAMQILRDFRLPEGASGDNIDANGDGEVLAVLDLGTDESLVEAGLAREVVNRVQKLRKKAGLVASDVVDVFLNPPHQPAGLLTALYTHSVHQEVFRKMCSNIMLSILLKGSLTCCLLQC